MRTLSSELRPHVQELGDTNVVCSKLAMSHAAGTSSVGHVSKKKRLVEPKSLGYSIGVIGSGNIARAIVEGVLASGRETTLYSITQYCATLFN